jgi:hypothetical protein
LLTLGPCESTAPCGQLQHRSSQPAVKARHGPICAPPVPLEHLHVLDLLELTGSQIKAARALAMHQSTVCRSAALMGGQLRIATDPLHQALLAGMVSVQAVPPLIRPSQEWTQRLSQASIDRAIVSSWCHPRVQAGERLPSWSGVITVPLGTLPLQLVSHTPATADATRPRKVLLPRRNVTPLLHEALAWHGFQLEQQPISCQVVPSWLKRMHDRQLAMPLCLGLVDPDRIESQSLVSHPEQPHLIEQFWLLLPQGLVGSSREACHLIRTLRQRVEKAGEVEKVEWEWRGRNSIGPDANTEGCRVVDPPLSQQEHGVTRCTCCIGQTSEALSWVAGGAGCPTRTPIRLDAIITKLVLSSHDSAVKYSRIHHCLAIYQGIYRAEIG